MTREEAIKMLGRLLLYCDLFECPHQDCGKCVEAISMAEEALEQEPNEDLISRQRLRENLKRELVIVNNNEMYWQGWHDCTVAVETRITDAPSVVPNEKYDYSKSVWENIKAGNGISKEIPKEPKEDCISRQDAIDALMRSSVYAWSAEEDQIAHEWALNIISKLPAKE